MELILHGFEALHLFSQAVVRTSHASGLMVANNYERLVTGIGLMQGRAFASFNRISSPHR